MTVHAHKKGKAELRAWLEVCYSAQECKASRFSYNQFMQIFFLGLLSLWLPAICLLLPAQQAHSVLLNAPSLLLMSLCWERVPALLCTLNLLVGHHLSEIKRGLNNTIQRCMITSTRVQIMITESACCCIIPSVSGTTALSLKWECLCQPLTFTFSCKLLHSGGQCEPKMA